MNTSIRILILVLTLPLAGCNTFSIEADAWMPSISMSGIRSALQSGFQLENQSELRSRANSVGKQHTRPLLKAEYLITQDFINAIMQIKAFVPWSTILYFKPSSEDLNKVHSRSLTSELSQRFGAALREVAVQRGYLLQYANDMGGTSVIEYDVYRSPTMHAASGENTFVYEVNISGVGFRRIYNVSVDGLVQPLGSMQLKGMDVTGVQPDDSIFDNQLKLTNNDSILITRNKDQNVNRGFKSPLATTALKTSDNNKKKTAPLVSIQKRNLAESKVSNFESLLAKREKVAEQTLVFNNDSFVMGSYNKTILNEVMSEFNPETDIVSVVGCSTGKTKFENGNAALAIGRANRVKEALLYRGVSHDKILDEGCWSPTADSTPFPNRGVVITVTRGVDERL